MRLTSAPESTKALNFLFSNVKQHEFGFPTKDILNVDALFLPLSAASR